LVNTGTLGIGEAGTLGIGEAGILKSMHALLFSEGPADA
jgi:hypothetical protein